MKTTAITGGSGLLAMNWAVAMRNRAKICLFTHKHNVNIAGVVSTQVSLDDVKNIRGAMNKFGADVVIHTAGMTNVDECERQPELAQIVNVDLACNVAMARPNFMKVAPLYRALKHEQWCEPKIIHTGQHYDAEMSDAFLRDLGLPDPDIQLGIGSGSHAEQTAGVMVAYERVCLEQRPDWTVVVGDVNSTMACTLAAKKLCIPVAHLEAGLRSGDRAMPEEINRIVTDALAGLRTPLPDANENL